MYHSSRRIEVHAKICVLALLFQRIAELECVRAEHYYIRRELEQVQVIEFFIYHLICFVSMRNELSHKPTNMLKSLKIKKPRQTIDLLETSEKM